MGPADSTRSFAAKSELPNADTAAREVLALPIFPELTAAQIEYVAAVVAEYFGA